MGFPNLLTSNEYQLFVWLNSENFVRSHQLTTAEGIRFAVGCCVVCDAHGIEFSHGTFYFYAGNTDAIAEVFRSE